MTKKKQGKSRKSKSTGGSTLKKALISCKGKKGEKWNKCLRSKGIKKK